jgi:hypothetical protein
MPTLTIQYLIRTLIVTFALLTGPQAFAASACKGQTNNACNQNNSCYWVAGYKRSDGANVKSHCRAKPKSSLKDSAQKTTKKATSTAVNKSKSESVKNKAASVSKKTTDKASQKKSKNAAKNKIKESEKKAVKKSSSTQ